MLQWPTVLPISDCILIRGWVLARKHLGRVFFGVSFFPPLRTKGGKVVKVTKRTTWPLFFRCFLLLRFFVLFPTAPLPLFPSSVSMTFAF